MSVIITKDVEVTFDFNYEELINNVIEKALDYIECPYETELSVTLTDNKNIHIINNEFRQIDRPTDVLSFPMIEYMVPGEFDFLENCIEYFNPETGELLLGDIIISVDKVKEQANEFGHTERRELAFLVAHSMLHLFGFDHMEENEMKIMENKQEEILEELQIKR
ncbi:MAG: rRNA maturation RNase YbeY [Lachnospiraceae bacterium]|nr:rRNA maturation RNase YbeY [Lachnospiraceae bacterium]